MTYQQADISHECEIVWQEDISKLDYVREVVVLTGTRQRPARYHAGRRIGYAVLDKKAPSSSGYFQRRVFILLPHDRDSQPDGVYKVGAPVEAVDPRTVLPKVYGQLTERAWGKPFAEGEEKDG